MQRWFPDFFDRFGAVTVFDLLVEYIDSGRIIVDKTRITDRIAYHDPCNYGRKSEELFGHGYFDEPRWVLDQCAAEWVDLFPAKSNQYCCGGGGGTLLTPYRGERLYYGRKKIEQIKRVDAGIIAVPCHSCHGQIKAVLAENEMEDIKVKYLWEIVADTLAVNKPEVS